MLQVLEQLCREVQQQATLYQESIRDAAELQDTTGVELFLGRGGGKARPMVEIKAEKVGSKHGLPAINSCATSSGVCLVIPAG